jgi:HK97 family phage major capsid protein
MPTNAPLDTVAEVLTNGFATQTLDRAVATIVASTDKPTIERLKRYLVENQLADADGADEYYLSKTALAFAHGQLTKEQLLEITEFDMATLADLNKEMGKDTGGAGAQIRVKKASERYNNESRVVTKPGTRDPLCTFGEMVRTPSEKDFAMIGAWMKHYVNSPGNSTALKDMGLSIPSVNEHERQLVEELYAEEYFCGSMKNNAWVDRATIDELKLNRKTLLEDATSGGQSLVPFQYDSAIISYPYLHSQILPFVDLRTASSSEVKTSTLGQVSVIWGIDEGTAIAEFDTDDLIGELEIPIHEVRAYIEWGKNLEMDTPVSELGQKLVEEFGQSLLHSLDKVVCVGDGTSQPEGIFNASGTVTVNSVGGTSAVNTLADWVALQFGIAKEYREQNWFPTYITNDTSYQRSRLIRIDPQVSTTDQRPVLGGVESYQSYRTAGYPHKINQNLGNSTLGFVCLKRYRLYRRAGFEFRISDQGKHFLTHNTKGMAMIGRYGGLLIDPNAAAIMPDAKS